MANEKITLRIFTELVDKGFKKAKKLIQEQENLTKKSLKAQSKLTKKASKEAKELIDKKAEASKRSFEDSKKIIEAEKKLTQEQYADKKAFIEKRYKDEVIQKQKLKRLADKHALKLQKLDQRELNRQKSQIREELADKKRSLSKQQQSERKLHRARLNRGRQLRRDFRKTENSIRAGFAQLNTFGGAFLRYTALAGGVLAGFGAITKKIIDTGAEFEQSMRNVGAILNVDDQELIASRTTSLAKEARELGASTAYTATEVAKGMGDLARAGLKADKIIGAIAPSLYLAGGAGVELTDSTKLMARTMAQFNLQARDAAKVADIFTIAMQNSLLDMQSLDSSMRYAGSSAGAFGFSIEETTAVVALFMDQVGLGSTAGTQFRHIMKSLGAPTAKAERVIDKLAKRMGVNAEVIRKNLNPATSDFVTMMNTLKPIMEDNVALTTLVNKRSSSTLQKILQDFHKGSSKYEDLMALFQSQEGQAERTYKAQIDTVVGQTQILRSMLQESFLNIFASISPSVRRIITILQDILKEATSVISLFVTQIQASFDQALTESGIENRVQSFGKTLGIYIVVFLKNITKLPPLLIKIGKALYDVAILVGKIWLLANFATMISGIKNLGIAIIGFGKIAYTLILSLGTWLAGLNGILAVSASLMSVLTLGFAAGAAITAMKKLNDYVKTMVPDVGAELGQFSGSVGEVTESLEKLEQTRKRVQDAFAEPLGQLFGDEATAGEIFEQHQEGINRIQKEILKLKPSDRRKEALSVLDSLAGADASELREGLSRGSLIRLQGEVAKRLIPEEQRQYLLSLNNAKDYALSLDAINAIIATQGEEATKKLHDSLREQRKIYTQELKAVSAAQKIAQAPSSSFKETEEKLRDTRAPSTEKENLEIVEVKFNVNAGNVEKTLENMRKTTTQIFEKQSKNTLKQLKEAKRFSEDLSEVVADLEKREEGVKEPRQTSLDYMLAEERRGIPQDLETQYNEVFDDIKRNAKKLSPVLNQGLIDYQKVIGGTAEQHANFVEQFQKNVQEATGATEEASLKMASRLFSGFVQHAAIVEATDEELTQRIITNQRAAVREGKKQYSILGDAYNDFVAPLLAAEQAIRADPDLNQEEINAHFLALTQLAGEIENLDSSYRTFQDSIDRDMFPSQEDKVGALNNIIRQRDQLVESLSTFKNDFTASVGDINDLLDKSIIKFGTFESVILQVLTAPSRAEIEKQKELERERSAARKRHASKLKDFYKKLISMERKAQRELAKVRDKSTNKYVADLKDRLQKLREFFRDGLKLFRKSSKARVDIIKRQYALMDKERQIARAKAVKDRETQTEQEAFEASKIDATRFEELKLDLQKKQEEFSKEEFGFAEILAMTAAEVGSLENKLIDLKNLKFTAREFQPNLKGFVSIVEQNQAGVVKSIALQNKLTSLITEKNNIQKSYDEEENEREKIKLKTKLDTIKENIKQVETEQQIQVDANKQTYDKKIELENLFLKYKKGLQTIPQGGEVDFGDSRGIRELTRKEVQQSLKMIDEALKGIKFVEESSKAVIDDLGKDLAQNLGSSADAVANRTKILAKPIVDFVEQQYYKRLTDLNNEYEQQRGKTIAQEHLDRVKLMEEELIRELGLPAEYTDEILSTFANIRLQLLKGYGRDINKIYRDEDEASGESLKNLERNNKLYEKSVKLRTRAARAQSISDLPFVSNIPVIGGFISQFMGAVAEKNKEEADRLVQLADMFARHELELKSVLDFAGDDVSSIDDLNELLADSDELDEKTIRLYETVKQIYDDTISRQKAEAAELNATIDGAGKLANALKIAGEFSKKLLAGLSAAFSTFSSIFGVIQQAIEFINKGLNFMTGGRLRLNPFELMTEAANELLAKQDEFIQKQKELDEELKARRITRSEYQAGVAVARSERGTASEVAKKLVDDMVDESVRFMNALIKVAPVIIEKLIERLPEITAALKKLVPQLARILDELFPVFIPVLTKLFTFAAQIFAKTVAGLLKGIFTGEGSGTGAALGSGVGAGLGGLIGTFLMPGVGTAAGTAVGAGLGGLIGAAFADTPMPMKMMKSYNDTPSPVRVKKQEGLVARFAHGDTVIAAKKPQELLRQALQAVGAEIKMGTRRPPPTPNSNLNSSGVASKIDIAVIAEGRVLDAVQMQAMERGHAPQISKRLRKASGVKVGFNRGRYNKFAVNEN